MKKPLYFMKHLIFLVRTKGSPNINVSEQKNRTQIEAPSKKLSQSRTKKCFYKPFKKTCLRSGRNMSRRFLKMFLPIDHDQNL